ncbi:hypothetical protein BCh11DRAFT_06249 [Burkholderia sp. Ch1-1]|uniref:hypothetical protein n=1 Tax=Paraburkholderia sp. USG1 TaxID=2952268 RepID=UPI0001D23D9D|nr:hypothetical protein [Paraburkholderia sp. USG1]EIF30747.1 hypothetical protein BCh11DRAFT_06249 [Burkholderia sp. Ch1-1]MDR8398590.1 hypothetical protein [Paraburkholderia sp. USG1]
MIDFAREPIGRVDANLYPCVFALAQLTLAQLQAVIAKRRIHLGPVVRPSGRGEYFEGFFAAKKTPGIQTIEIDAGVRQWAAACQRMFEALLSGNAHVFAQRVLLAWR